MSSSRHKFSKRPLYTDFVWEMYQGPEFREFASSRSQVVSITSANYHLISPSIETACAVVMFITDTFDQDKYSQA